MKKKLGSIVFCFLILMCIVQPIQGYHVLNYCHPRLELTEYSAIMAFTVAAIETDGTDNATLMNEGSFDPSGEPPYGGMNYTAYGNTSNIWFVWGQTPIGVEKNINITVGRFYDNTTLNFDLVGCSSPVDFNDSEHMLIIFLVADLMPDYTLTLVFGGIRYDNESETATTSSTLFVIITAILIVGLVMIAAGILTSREDDDSRLEAQRFWAR